MREACRAALVEAHEEALVAGLCGEGAWEAALGSLSRLGAEELLARARSGDREPSASPVDRK
ncbi:MAG TPA: acetyltransferase [Thermoanaerobaculia bacterium]|nr:acetyltransferase [Thermoanaerobaculia bacterium]